MKDLVLVLLGLVFVGAVGASAVGRPVVPAMFVLGDSTLDVGNNNHLPGKDVPRANEPFYGIDFPGGAKATGRFSNGYNIADFIGTYHHASSQLLYVCMCRSCADFIDCYNEAATRHLGFERSPLAYLVLKSRNYLIPSALTRGVSYVRLGGIRDPRLH